ncbi:CshA/CshB family fibrillar adhesin-related protein [Niabella beijingensis]|uniref:CshA/CshB family fibrillar adhesin-related protein n=1 Tax=Niabella beijingensis TaxID=2872700 RepID=UPI001CBF87BA|nr:CshA/CshB family fibrillar adhesin-related protein [Niabella beijingensis]MBZ4190520.1 hypothetical protein [Niabella beijingensis]
MKKIHAPVIGTLLCFFLSTFTTFGQYFGASVAKRGNGNYRGSIYWINWDVNDDGRPGDAIASGAERVVNTPQGIVYTIKITKINNNNNNLESYTPGQWPYDDVKTGYNWFSQSINNANQYTGSYNYRTSPLSDVYDNKVDAHNSVIGIRNATDGQRVNFRVTVTARLGNKPISILGMVAVGAESLGGSPTSPYRESESFTAGNSDAAAIVAAWQAFDKVQNAYAGPYRSTSFRTVANVSNGGKTVMGHNPDRTGEGPGEMIWFSQGANQIDVDLKGGGVQAIAIGFIGTYDFGDAPLSYGTVSHELDVSFSNGAPAIGTDIKLASLSLANRNAPKFTIGTLADNDADQFYSDDLLGDDIHDLKDEDGLPNPYKATIIAGANKATFSIPVQNKSGAAGTLWAWIDINKNGIFEASERGTAVNVPNNQTGNVTLNFTNLPGTFQPFKSYPMRLRLAQAIPDDNTSTAIDEGSIGVASGGEVEDHLLRVPDAPVTGVIFQDVNQNGLQEAAEPVFTGTGMFVYLIDADNRIIEKAPVVDGAYTITQVPVNVSLTDLNARLVATAHDLAVGTTLSDLTGTPPVGYIKTGKDLTKAGNNVSPVGNKTDFQIKFTGTVPESGIQHVNFGMYPLVLAVNFGAINARISGDQLTVNWVTETEENNHHFDVEVSTDGMKFVKWATVKTKAAGGNSSQELSYAVSGSLNTAAGLMGASLFSIAFLGLLFLKNRRKLLSVVCFIGLVTMGVSCKKTDQALDPSAKKVFVRIVQYDTDGTSKYSKTVQAVADN